MTILEAKKILELNSLYDEKKLKKQYKAMIIKYHPDNCAKNNIPKELSEQRIRQINNAYELLKQQLKYTSNEKSTFKKRNDSNNDYKSDYEKAYETAIRQRKILEAEIQEIQSSSYCEKLFEVMKKFNATEIIEMSEIYKNKLIKFLLQLSISNENLNQLHNEFNKATKDRKKILDTMTDKFWNEYFYKYIPKTKSGQIFWKRINIEIIPFIKKANTLPDWIKSTYNVLHKIDLIKKKIDNKMLEYYNYAYYEILKEKLEEEINNIYYQIFQELTITSEMEPKIFSKKIDRYLEKLSDRVMDVFNNYASFLDSRQIIIEELQQKINQLNLNDDDKMFFEINMNKLKTEMEEEKFTRLRQKIDSKIKVISASTRFIKRLKTSNEYINYNKYNNYNEYINYNNIYQDIDYTFPNNNKIKKCTKKI